MKGDSRSFLAASADPKMIEVSINSLSDSLISGNSALGYQFPDLSAIVSCNQAT